MMRVIVGSLLLIGAASDSASTQATPAREVIRGKVVGQDGKPCAGALVRFALLLGRDETGKPQRDVVNTRCDAAGRFRTKILSNRPYSAWAVIDHAKGTYRTTPLRTRVFAGRPLRLEVTRDIRHRVQVMVRGEKRWKKFGPIQYWLVAEDVAISLPLELNAQGEILLPRLPGNYCAVQAYQKTGIPLIDGRQSVISLRGQQSTRIELRLADPYPVAIRVVDEEKTPIQGATLFWRDVGSTRVRLAETDVRGFGYVILPAQRLPVGSTVFNYIVEANGFGETFGQRILEHRDDKRTLEQLRKSGTEDILVELAPGYTLRGRVLLTESTPAASVPLSLESYVSLGTAVFPQSPRTHWTDTKGRFEIPSRNHGFAFRLSAVLTWKQLESLASSSDFTHQRTVVLASGPGARQGDLDLGDIRIDQLHPVDIRVVHDDGTPVRNPIIFVADAKRSHGHKGQVPGGIRLSGPPTGRLRLLLPRSDRLCIAALSSTSVREIAIRVPPTKDNPSLSPLLVRLRPTTLVRGRVVDSDGKPVSSAEVYREVKAAGKPASFLMQTGGAAATTNRDGAFEFRVSTHFTYRILVGVTRNNGKSYDIVGETDVDVREKPVLGIEIEIRREGD